MHEYIAKPVIFVLCASILIQGCYSYSYLSKDEMYRESLTEKNIVITLANGSRIDSPRYRHIYTTERSDFIYGIGKWRHQFSIETPFIGRLERSFIDSFKVDKYASAASYACYLTDGNIISFKPGDYVSVTPDQPPGLWCTGIIKVQNRDSLFSGRISEEEIRSVSEKKEEILPVIVLAVGGAACTIMIFTFLNSGLSIL